LENIEDLWQYILTEMQSKISKPSYDTWLSQTAVKELNQDILSVTVPNEFTKNWLDQRYTDVIDTLLFEMTGSKLSVKFVIEDEEENEDEKESFEEKQEFTPARHNKIQNMLNPKYTFDTFVVGAANRFAHAASLAVAEAPAKSYNPLFIYGGVGLGKTHLMHAIAHYVRDYHPDRRVLYLSS